MASNGESQNPAIRARQGDGILAPVGRFGQIGFRGVAGGVIAAFVLVLAPGVWAAAPTVEDLVGLLGGNRSPKVRAQAALNLAGIESADDRVIDALVRGLEDEAPMVRGSCAKALGNFASIRTFQPLAKAALDADPFVAKWAGWAVRRVVAAAPVVTVGLRKLAVSAGPLTEPATKAFQEGVLAVVVAGRRFDIPPSFDFSDEVKEADDPADSGQRKDAAAGSPVVHLELEGELLERAGDPVLTTATVTMRAVCASGFAVWTGTTSATAKGIPTPPPSEDDDEFSLRPEPVDALLPAMKEAGKGIARQFVESVDSKEWGIR